MDERICRTCGGSGVEQYDSKAIRFRVSLHRWTMVVCALGLIWIGAAAIVVRGVILWDDWFVTALATIYTVGLFRRDRSAGDANGTD